MFRVMAGRVTVELGCTTWKLPEPCEGVINSSPFPSLEELRGLEMLLIMAWSFWDQPQLGSLPPRVASLEQEMLLSLGSHRDLCVCITIYILMVLSGDCVWWAPSQPGVLWSPPALVLVGPLICLHSVCSLLPAHLPPGSPMKVRSVWVSLCSQSRLVAAAEGKGLNK